MSGALAAVRPRTARWTLRRRLVALLIGLVATVAALMAAASTLALRGTLVAQLDERLIASSERAGDAQRDGELPEPPLLSDGSLPDRGDLPPGLETPGQGAGTLTLEVRDGVVRSGYIDQEGTFQALTEEQEAVLSEVAADGRPATVELDELGAYRVVAVTTEGGDLLVTGLSLDEASAVVQAYLIGEGLVLAAGIAIAAAAGTALVRRELHPLERVAATATRVSEQPLERGEVTLRRVPDADTDPGTEVGQVGAALNRMLGHVEGALAARHESETQVRQFVADASHELRTPLASIRGYAELVRRLPDALPDDALRAMERVESESRRMTALVEDMLLLARLDAGRSVDGCEVDLAALAVDAVSDAHVAGRDHVWQLDLPGGDEDEDAPACTVLGDDHRLRQVLVNLLSNARVHTPPGTTVLTSVRTDGTTVTVQVRDDGPGIPEELRPRLFQRFTRGDAARSPGTGSTGLGLAIVAAVVAAHGGTITADGTPGATTFTVRLPAAS